MCAVGHLFAFAVDGKGVGFHNGDNIKIVGLQQPVGGSCDIGGGHGGGHGIHFLAVYRPNPATEGAVLAVSKGEGSRQGCAVGHLFAGAINGEGVAIRLPVGCGGDIRRGHGFGHGGYRLAAHCPGPAAEALALGGSGGGGGGQGCAVVHLTAGAVDGEGVGIHRPVGYGSHISRGHGFGHGIHFLAAYRPNPAEALALGGGERSGSRQGRAVGHCGTGAVDGKGVAIRLPVGYGGDIRRGHGFGHGIHSLAAYRPSPAGEALTLGSGGGGRRQGRAVGHLAAGAVNGESVAIGHPDGHTDYISLRHGGGHGIQSFSSYRPGPAGKGHAFGGGGSIGRGQGFSRFQQGTVVVDVEREFTNRARPTGAQKHTQD